MLNFYPWGLSINIVEPISVNKTKVGVAYVIEKKDLINDKYILINKGKKSTFLVKFT